MSEDGNRLAVELGGLALQNPIVLAAGTAAYGDELEGVMDLELLGGLVTKAVSVEPRKGAPAPRVADFPGGMINAVGLANPGMEEVAGRQLPWLAAHVRKARVLVNVVGYEVDDYARVVARLGPVAGKDGFELNVSCPNVKAGGMEFGADPAALSELVRRARAETALPLFVKLSPTLPDIARTAIAALEVGATGISVVNTLPGLVIDVKTRRPALGFGTGGVSGPGLLPVGVLATWKVFRAIGSSVPIIGIGGVATADDALQYVLAGASAVGMGTSALKDPRAPARLVRHLGDWCNRQAVSLSRLRGTLQWPS